MTDHSIVEKPDSRDEVESNRNWDNNNYEKHDGTSMKKRLR